jgi:hypothetical protein
MARKCTLKTCRSELPTKVSSDSWQARGFCNIECMVEHGSIKGKEALERKRKADELGIKKRNQSFKRKVELKDTRGQKDKTQSAFNKVIKLEELWRCAQSGEQPICISCSKPWTPFTNYDFAAGHFLSRGSRPDLALNNNNCFLQCNGYCNSALSANRSGVGNTHGYDEGLIMRLGCDGTKKLIKSLEVVTSFKWTGEDYEILRKWLNARARYLTKELELFNDINQS